MPRAVTEQLRARMSGPETDCAVTGRAGTGKSGCIAEFVQGLKDGGVPVLAFRLDRVDPVKSTVGVGAKRSGSKSRPPCYLAPLRRPLRQR